MKKILVSMLALFAIATTAVAQNEINGHEYVDLGLPSGLLWATCNVGATKPEDYGDYFAWGETQTKGDRSNYSWATYEWRTEDAMTKYTKTDGKIKLDPDDDAAAVNWGGGWRMPTKEDFKELLDNTTCEWKTVNEVKGHEFTAKNGKSIFLPASGNKQKDRLTFTDESYYWSSSLNEEFGTYAHELSSLSAEDEVKLSYCLRYWGNSVRPVIEKPSGIAIDATNFPDANFRSFVAAKAIDKDENGYLTDAEIAAVKGIDVNNKNIANLKGIEHFTALENLYCQGNPLKSLDVSKNTKLKGLYSFYNELTELDVSKNIYLTNLTCYRNQISGDKMQALVESLPKVESGTFSVFKLDDEKEKNVITKSQVALAKSKGWKVWACKQNGDEYEWSEYEGSDDTPTDPKTLAVTFTKATTLLTDLSKQDELVLSAVLTLAQKKMLSGYSVEIDSRTKRVTLKKDGRTPRDASKTLFVIVPNKEIKVSSDVTSADNINVTLTDNLRKALTTDQATQLASYDAIQIKFDTTTAIDASLNDNGQMINDSWYSIDGKRLSGEPTQKGVYIVNGKKVVK